MPRKTVHKEKMDRNKIWLVSFLSFLMGVISSSLIYVTSDYIKESTGLNGVGSFYVVAYVTIFLLLLYFHKIVNRIGKIRTFLLIQFIKILVLFVLTKIPFSNTGAALITFYSILSYMTWVEMDAILETFSIDKMSGRIRGVYLLLSNIGYMAGPLVATRLLDKWGYSSVFTFTIIISSLLFITTLIKLRNVREDIREILEPKQLLKKAFRNKNVFNIYLVSIALELFYALAIVYIPLHLLEQGFDWSEVGTIIICGMVPFVFLQYPAGLLADKKTGEKELIFLAIILTSVSTASLYFFESSSVISWAFMLIMVRVGPSILEILRDSYFYKKVDGRDLDMIDFFRTAGPVGIVFGTLLSSITLLYFPMKFIFLLSGILIILGLIPVVRLADNISEEEAELGEGEIKFRTRLSLLKVLGKRVNMRMFRAIIR